MKSSSRSTQSSRTSRQTNKVQEMQAHPSETMHAIGTYFTDAKIININNRVRVVEVDKNKKMFRGKNRIMLSIKKPATIVWYCFLLAAFLEGQEFDGMRGNEWYIIAGEYQR